jgi:putative restriction endonuclease
LSVRTKGVNGVQEYCGRFQALHTGQHEGRPRPHKAVLLLAVLSLADNGQLAENKIVYGPELLELFKRFFAVVRGPSDQCTPWNPFFFLRSERFWHLHAVPGKEALLEAMDAPRSAAKLAGVVAFSSFDEVLFALVAQPASREALRMAIIDRYFTARRTELLAVCGEERDIGRVRETWVAEGYRVGRGDADGASDSVRSAVFGRVVKQAYDYRCAACRVRFLYEDIMLVDAAHLVPFSESHDDSPQNGMALCKNHHWLMDTGIIAPGPAKGGNYEDLRWYVRKGLDGEIEGQKEVLLLVDKTVILPRDVRLRPKREAVERRMAMLEEAC